MPPRLLPTLLLCLPLAACGNHDTGKADPAAANNASPAAETGAVSQALQDATDSARKEFAHSNIDVSNGQPDKAELTPQGDFLINGKAVSTDASQRALLLDYRKQVEAVASAGMDIGLAGANLGVKAADEALKGIVSGNTRGLKDRANGEASQIKAQARQLCALLPAMMATQQALAAALPAFKPYATMDQAYIDACNT